MQTEFMNPFGLEIDLSTGDMPQATNHIIRRASDMRGYYADTCALEKLIAENDDPLHYEVFESPVPKTPASSCTA